jgi:hypothetical protein
MHKVTLTFPNPDSLWLFKDKSKAINVAVAPRKNTITGLFSPDEIDIAVKEFQAVQIMNASTNKNAPPLKYTQTGTIMPLFRFKFSQLLSALNL